MDWFWTWSGECFGYRWDHRLFAYDGRQVGKFHGEEVYGSGGRYLGEIMSDNRLITNTGKKGWIRSEVHNSRNSPHLHTPRSAPNPLTPPRLTRIPPSKLPSFSVLPPSNLPRLRLL